ncbi:phosphoprotein [Tioman virus]|uniref:Phosphoprotein n=1 Tax=Tioman virus TaxID=162013 RepID=Q8JVB1_9MONO|nr:phosphoprotein [Tioman virus]AAM82283.1 phosphoprotein [Tioman virus]
MDPSPSDAEISAWIDKGLDTVEHFLSASTQSVRSLGKSTIKPGNTEELVAAAEKVAANTAKGILSGVRGTNPDPATRPKEKQKGSPVKMQHQEQESVYEEVIPTESAPLIPKTTPKKPPRNKEKVMSMMALSPPDESLDETHEAVFKRGGVPPPHGRGATGQGDTGGKSPSAGQPEPRGSQNGATQYVTQYPNSPTGEPAGAGAVQMSAPCVREIMHYLQTLETRIANLDWKVDKLLSQQTTITQIKNDQHTIKASLATIEGLITTIKIMDPGVGPGATASQAKRIFKEAPVVISGPILGDNPIIGAEAIQLDELARPSPAKPRQVKQSGPSSSAIVGYKSTLQSLVKECISNPSMRQKFDLAISNIKSEQDFKQVRRDIIRSAT